VTIIGDAIVAKITGKTDCQIYLVVAGAPLLVASN